MKVILHEVKVILHPVSRLPPAQIASLAYTGCYSVYLHDREGPPVPSCVSPGWLHGVQAEPHAQAFEFLLEAALHGAIYTGPQPEATISYLRDQAEDALET